MTLHISHIANGAIEEIAKTRKHAQKTVSSHPFGLPMAGREHNRNGYRKGYQGEWTENDEETGEVQFQLRMYSPILGRWLSVDPERQHASPYLSMGNNPIRRTDPDGGLDIPFIDVSFLDDPGFWGNFGTVLDEVEIFGMDESNGGSFLINMLTMLDSYFQNGEGIEFFNSGVSGSGFNPRKGTATHAIIDPAKMLMTFGKDPTTYKKGHIPVPDNLAKKINDILKESKNARDALSKLALDDDFVRFLNEIRINDVHKLPNAKDYPFKSDVLNIQYLSSDSIPGSDSLRVFNSFKNVRGKWIGDRTDTLRIK
ncbi:MAG: RHS repeat-associated core domain-containing protein [Bacteroidota bacterium]